MGSKQYFQELSLGVGVQNSISGRELNDGMALRPLG